MASIEKRIRDGQLRWVVRYRDPDGAQRARPFGRKVDAGRFLTKTEGDKLRGAYVDPKEAARTFRDFAEQHWHSYSHTLAGDTTRIRKRSVLDNHIPSHPGSQAKIRWDPAQHRRRGDVRLVDNTCSRDHRPGPASGSSDSGRSRPRRCRSLQCREGAVRPPTAPRRRDVHPLRRRRSAGGCGRARVVPKPRSDAHRSRSSRQRSLGAPSGRRRLPPASDSHSTAASPWRRHGEAQDGFFHSRHPRRRPSP